MSNIVNKGGTTEIASRTNEAVGIRMCMECGQNFDPAIMLQVGRKMLCKECSQDMLAGNQGMQGGKVTIVNQQTTGVVQNSGEAGIQRKHSTALALSIILGWAGIDRFYLGQPLLGLCKMITLGGYGLWWVADIFLISSKSIRNIRWV